MKFLADESVDEPIVARLRKDGHSVAYVAELSPGISDDEVLTFANSQQAILLTMDKDFGELVFRLGRVHAGVVLARFSGLDASMKAELVSQAIKNHGSELPGAFGVLSPGSLRIRR